MTLQEIKEQLKTGDNQTIHELTGYSLNYISLVLNGKRNNKRILTIAEKVINSREQAKESLKEEIKNK